MCFACFPSAAAAVLVCAFLSALHSRMQQGVLHCCVEGALILRRQAMAAGGYIPQRQFIELDAS